MRQQDEICQQKQGEIRRFSMILDTLKENIESTELRIAECNRQIFDGNGTDICIWDQLDPDRSTDKRRTYIEAKEEFSRVMPAMRGRFNAAKEAFESTQQQLESIPTPFVSNKLMMLNIIHVI